MCTGEGGYNVLMCIFNKKNGCKGEIYSEIEVTNKSLRVLINTFKSESLSSRIQQTPDSNLVLFLEIFLNFILLLLFLFV